MNTQMDEESNGVKPEWKISDALKTAWSTYKKFGRSVRLHINTWTFFLLYVIAFRIFGFASTRIVIFLAVLSWLAAIYMDLEVLYRRVYRTLIGKAFLAIGFVATTIMAHAISSIVVNSVTGVDPSKFPYTVTLLSLMCVPFFVLSASIPLFVLLLIFAPVAFLFLTQDRGACWRWRRIDHPARFRLTISTDSEPSPRARLEAADPGQSIFGNLVKARRAPTVRAHQERIP